jgi:hypothetical protein
MLTLSKPDAARQFFAEAQADAGDRRKFYEFMQSRIFKADAAPSAEPEMSAAAEPPPGTGTP